MELEFETRKWRLIRFLRVIGDVRINTSKQSLFEFIDWAHEHTGVPRSNVYYQLFPAHEGMFPGYATAYAVVGEEIHAIEDTINDDKTRIKFSTYLTGIGFPPRSMYRQMLAGLRGRSLARKRRCDRADWSKSRRIRTMRSALVSRRLKYTLRRAAVEQAARA